MNGDKPRPNETPPLFSVITVVFNGAAHLEQAISSVIGQTCADYEYIVIDGGSDDGSLDIIKKYERHIGYWVSEGDNGIYDAMNKGIARARGAFICMLNADDWYEPDFLEKMARKIGEPPDRDGTRVVFCHYYSHDESFSPPLKKAEVSVLNHRRGMTVSHQAMMIPRAVYQKLGPYSLDYRFASDYEYLMRMVTNKVPFEGLDYYGVNFRKGGASTAYMTRSIGEVSRIVRTYSGIFSKEYLLFLLTNRLPSLLSYVRRVLTFLAGKQTTDKLRRRWRNEKTL